jgi:hypothetical protein
METIPYTYKLIFKPTGQYYYGVRYANNCNPNDLWDKYFTSSKYIHKLIKEYGLSSFDYKITKTFKNKKDAINYEHQVLKRVKADVNGKFINKTTSKAIPSMCGLIVINHSELNLQTFHDPSLPIPEGWVRGFKKSHINSMSKVRLGKPAHNKGKNGKPTGPCSDERKNNIKKTRLQTKKIECQFCGKECDPGNHKRFHGGNCKFNPYINQQVIKERKEIAIKSYLTQVKNNNFNNVKPPKGDFKCPYCDKKSNNKGAMNNHIKVCQNFLSNIDILHQ